MAPLILLTSGSVYIHQQQEEYIGRWTGNEIVTVRTQSGFGHYKFTSSQQPVLISIQITDENHITGTIGNAILRDCELIMNRGWIGRQLNIKTDYRISGKLSGLIFPGDPISEKAISIPFNITNGKVEGSLFQLQNGLYPMCTIHLSK